MGGKESKREERMFGWREERRVGDRKECSDGGRKGECGREERRVWEGEKESVGGRKGCSESEWKFGVICHLPRLEFHPNIGMKIDFV